MRTIAGSVLFSAGTLAGISAAYLAEYRPPALRGELPRTSVLVLAALAVLDLAVGFWLLRTASREREQ